MATIRNLADFTALIEPLPDLDTLQTSIQQIPFVTAVFNDGISHVPGSDDWVFDFNPDPLGGDLAQFNIAIASHTGIRVKGIKEIIGDGISSTESDETFFALNFASVESKAEETNSTTTWASKLTQELAAIDATWVITATGVMGHDGNNDSAEFDLYEAVSDVTTDPSLLAESPRAIKDGPSQPDPMPGITVKGFIATSSSDSPAKTVGVRWRMVPGDTGNAVLSGVTIQRSIQRT